MLLVRFLELRDSFGGLFDQISGSVLGGGLVTLNSKISMEAQSADQYTYRENVGHRLQCYYFGLK